MCYIKLMQLHSNSLSHQFSVWQTACKKPPRTLNKMRVLEVNILKTSLIKYATKLHLDEDDYCSLYAKQISSHVTMLMYWTQTGCTSYRWLPVRIWSITISQCFFFIQGSHYRSPDKLHFTKRVFFFFTLYFSWHVTHMGKKVWLR